MNMLWKTTPTGWVKAVWWDVKEIGKRLKKEIVPREAVGKANHIIPRPIMRAVCASLMALKAGSKWPAVLARAAPMTPAQGADEGGARAPPRPKETPALQVGEEVSRGKANRAGGVAPGVGPGGLLSL